MKTKLAISLTMFALATGRSLLAGDSSEPSRASTLLPQSTAPVCCAADKPTPAVAPCCTEEKLAVPLSAHSLYQLDANWTNDAGATVQLATLHGRPVVAAMFFANCQYACPIIVSEMKRLGDTLTADVRARTQFVLVSFDSARDTPEALKAYRERMALGADWTLLHGDPAAVQELAMLLGVKYKQDARGQFSHSNQITILNPEGEIVHQRAGLMGDVSEAAKAVVVAAK